MLNKDLKAGLGVAFNEATLLGVEVSEPHREASITLALLTLPADGGPAPEDPRVSVLLKGVSRVAASLREGHWDDKSASVNRVPLDSLLNTVQSFQGLPIYGWEFFDLDKDFQKWRDRLSLDVSLHPEPAAHSVTLFQEGVGRHLDIRIWFDELIMTDARGTPLKVEQVIQDGQRWWKAMYEGDARTHGSGIFSAGEETDDEI